MDKKIEDRNYNPGGTGCITAGDHSHAYGDVSEGSNQRNRIVLMMLECGDVPRNHMIRVQPGFSYRVYVDGELDDAIVRKDITVRQYKRGFLHRPRLCIMAMNHCPTAITVPTTVVLSDCTYLDCTVTAYIVCNPDDPGRLADILNGDYTEVVGYGTSGSKRYLNAECLSKIIRNTMTSIFGSVMVGHTSPSDAITTITSQLLDANRRNGILAMQGLRVVGVDFSFDECEEDEFRRIKMEIFRKHDLDIFKLGIEQDMDARKLGFKFDGRRRVGGGST